MATVELRYSQKFMPLLDSLPKRRKSDPRFFLCFNFSLQSPSKSLLTSFWGVRLWHVLPWARRKWRKKGKKQVEQEKTKIQKFFAHITYKMPLPQWGGGHSFCVILFMTYYTTNFTFSLDLYLEQLLFHFFLKPSAPVIAPLRERKYYRSVCKWLTGESYTKPRWFGGYSPPNLQETAGVRKDKVDCT